MAKNAERWYSAGARLGGWKKTLSADVRRRKALASRNGNALATAHALQSLANVTTDPETQRVADADAQYFFDMHNRRKQRR